MNRSITSQRQGTAGGRLHAQQQQQYPPERPIVSTGRYNLDFFDGNNEFEHMTSRVAAGVANATASRQTNSATPGPSTAFRSPLTPQQLDEGYDAVFSALAGAAMTDGEFARIFPYERLLLLDQGLEHRGGLTTGELRMVLGRTRAAGPSDECSICLSRCTRPGGRTGESVAVLPCTHAFHTECLRPWLQSHSTCPLCRASARTCR